MDKNMNEALSTVLDSTIQVVTDAVPELAPLFNGLQLLRGPETIADAIFLSKLKRLLSKQESDFKEWLEISSRFDSSQEKYTEDVRKLIFMLNSMNEDRSIDAYGNLLHAYQLNLLTHDDFFRLSWILSQAYYDDLDLLRKLKEEPVKIDYERLSHLEPYGLLNKKTATHYNIGPKSTYSLSELGTKMLACGLDYDNYYQYKNESTEL